MLKQNKIIDVATWSPDSDYGVFPQGARAKDALISPAQQACHLITPNKRYLFKLSRQCYPDQFWAEIIAYRIGTLLGLEVPPAFAAWNSDTNKCAALIEWFYVDGEEVSVHAGDFLTKIQPEFDRKTGKHHNLRDCTILLRALTNEIELKQDWRQWWANAIFFDALIGNTDRHQDNWGILFVTDHKAKKLTARLSPLFDNGTSLGHERFPEKFRNWNKEDYNRYITKGRHHISWSMDKPQVRGHAELLSIALKEWPETKEHIVSMAQKIDKESIVNAIVGLTKIECPTPLKQDRFDFVCTLLCLRIERLKKLLL